MVPKMVPLSMGTKDKKLQSMANNPKGDWKIEDLKALANGYGITYNQPGTSHVTFRTTSGQMLTVPAHKPIKAIYIKKFLELIENEEVEKNGR